MIHVDIENLQAELIRRFEHQTGDEFLQIHRNGKPIGVIRIIEGVSSEAQLSRPIGLAAGTFKVPPEFFEPLPEDVLAAFNGE